MYAAWSLTVLLLINISLPTLVTESSALVVVNGVLGICTVTYLLLAGALARREHIDGVRQALQVEYVPESYDYRSIDYRSLPVAFAMMPRYLTFAIGLTISGFGFLIFTLLLVVAIPRSQLETSALQWLATAVLLVGAVVTVWGYSLVKKRKEDVGDANNTFEKFVSKNHFSLTRNSYDEVLKEVYAENISLALPGYSLASIETDVSGQYRGSQFHMGLLRVKRHDKIGTGFMGVTLYAPPQQMSKEELYAAIEPSWTGEMRRFVGREYVVIVTPGFSRDKANLIKMFQVFDNIADAPQRSAT